MSRRRTSRRTVKAPQTPSPTDRRRPAPTSNQVRPWQQAKDARWQQRLAEEAARRHRLMLARRAKRATAEAVVVAVVIGLVAWQRIQEAPSGPGGLQEPEGRPSVAQDVNTLVGQPAPVFPLGDARLAASGR